MNITIADLIEIAGLRATIRGNGKIATSGRDGIRSEMGMRSSSSHCPRPRCRRRESRSGVHHRPAMSQAWIRRLTRRSHLCLCRREQGQRRMRRAVVSRNQGCTLAFHLRAWGLTSGTLQAGRRRSIGARTSTATSIRSAVRRPTRRPSATADRSLITQQQQLQIINLPSCHSVSQSPAAAGSPPLVTELLTAMDFLSKFFSSRPRSASCLSLKYLRGSNEKLLSSSPL